MTESRIYKYPENYFKTTSKKDKKIIVVITMPAINPDKDEARAFPNLYLNFLFSWDIKSSLMSSIVLLLNLLG